MEITKKNLIELIKEISQNIDKLNYRLAEQEKIIGELEFQNKKLKQSNLDTLDQIKIYIKELEQIRSHYVDSNINTSR